MTEVREESQQLNPMVPIHIKGTITAAHFERQEVDNKQHPSELKMVEGIYFKLQIIKTRTTNGLNK